MSQKKKWFKSAFEDDSFNDVPSTPKKSRTLPATIDLTQDDPEIDHIPPPSASNSQIQSQIKSKLNLKNFNPASSNWIEIFEPNTSTDLAIHHKKIAEVQDWLRHYEVAKKQSPGQMLLITGPAGVGKTATVKVLAKEMKYELVEWITPVDVDLIRNGQLTINNDQDTYRESQADIFKQFLFKSSRYKSVFKTQQRRLVLVEDFPNVFIRDSEGFVELLENYRTYGKSPLIFVVTDTKSKQLNLAYNLFPDKVREEYQINHISFNPISATLMKKALNRICSLMRQDGFSQFYEVPASNVVESVHVSAQGDIRNAVINLHFASLKGAQNLKTEYSAKGSTNKNSKKCKGKSLKSIGRDESITLMHALGRVFHPKYEENIKPAKFVHAPEELADSFSSEPKMFVSFLHSNYLAHFSSIENILDAANHLSLSDILMSEYREDDMLQVGLNVAIRSVMVSNEKPVTGWLPVKGYKRGEGQRGKLEEEMRKLGVKNELSTNVLVSDYRTYAQIIQPGGVR